MMYAAAACSRRPVDSYHLRWAPFAASDQDLAMASVLMHLLGVLYANAQCTMYVRLVFAAGGVCRRSVLQPSCSPGLAPASMTRACGRAVPQVAFSAFTDFGPIMALAIALHNIPEVRGLRLWVTG